MYVTITRYAGLANKIEEARPMVERDFLALLRGQPGFHGYMAMPSEEGDVVAVTLWDSAIAANDSREKIVSFVADNLPDYTMATERLTGEVGAHAVAEPKSGGLAQSLYCVIRKAENLSDEDAQSPVRKELITTVTQLPGFRGVYYMRSDADPTEGASILLADTRDHTVDAHETTIRMITQMAPDMVVKVWAAGPTAILATA